MMIKTIMRMWPLFGFIDILLDPIGAILGHDSERKNRNLQEDFAKKGIGWRVADAKQAGLHPLAALGASTSQPAAIPAGQSPIRGSVGLFRQKAKADIEKTKAETQMIRSKISPASPPAPGINPQLNLQRQNKPGFIGRIPMFAHAMGPGNNVAQVVPNPELSEVYESSIVDKMFNNFVRGKMFASGNYGSTRPPLGYLKPNHYWHTTDGILWEQRSRSSRRVARNMPSPVARRPKDQSRNIGYKADWIRLKRKIKYRKMPFKGVPR